ncbi:MAG: NCS2 family permease [Bdellovibrionales bacterium]|nr:NCS2 family permease [Bdellovibrionales bacterium]
MKPEHKSEIIGGLTTFLTMSYIVVVNPSILSSPGSGMSFSGVMTATVLLCFSMTLLMGIYAKLPYAVAPGLGINAFFTYTIVIGYGVPWQQALGIVFWAGVLFLITSITPIRVKIVQSIPVELRTATAVGIGFFLAFIGLKNAGLIKANPETFVQIGAMNGEVLLSLVGLLILLFLYSRKNPFAFIGSIFAITILGILSEKIRLPSQWVSLPDFNSVFFKLDIIGALKLSLLPALFAIFFTDLFDSISTFVGVSQATKLVDSQGEPKNLREGLIVDAFATLFAGLFGTSSGTAYIESASGIEAGGRKGLSAVVTAFLFLPLLFISPIASVVPAYATAPVLIFVGYLMFKMIREIPFDQIEKAIPCFLTIILIPLTFSITQGILWGIVSHIVMHWIVGKQKKLQPMVYLIGACCLGLLWIQ